MSEMPFPEYSYVPEFTLGDRLRRAREAVGMTQTEIADAIEAHQRSISNYEADTTIPKIAVLRAWAYVTQVNLSWLAWGDPSTPPPTKATWPTGTTGRRRVTRAVTSGYPIMSQMGELNDNRLVPAA